MGQFANLREYPTAAFKAVTAPNADTLYSSAWLARGIVIGALPARYRRALVAVGLAEYIANLAIER
jgi:hypothetical protein